MELKISRVADKYFVYKIGIHFCCSMIVLAELHSMICWLKLMSQLLFYEWKCKSPIQNMVKSGYLIVKFSFTMANRGPWILGYTFGDSRDICIITTMNSCPVLCINQWTSTLEISGYPFYRILSNIFIENGNTSLIVSTNFTLIEIFTNKNALFYRICLQLYSHLNLIE